jgi:hypothetical protein
VTKESANKGRLFYKCSVDYNKDGTGCGFFEFQDELPATQAMPMNVVKVSLFIVVIYMIATDFFSQVPHNYENV